MTTDPEPIIPTPNPEDTPAEAAKDPRQAHKELFESLAAKAAESKAESEKKKEAERPKIPDATTLYFPGTMAERTDMLIGLLTNAAVESLLLADGNCPELTEQGYAEHKAFSGAVYGEGSPPPKYTGAVTAYLAARSANLRDAVRASEAVARLMTTQTLAHKACAGQSTMVVDDWRDGGKRRRRVRVIKRFPIPLDDAVLQTAPPGAESAGA